MDRKNKRKLLIIALLIILLFLLFGIFIQANKVFHFDNYITNKTDSTIRELDDSQGDYIKPEDINTHYDKNITLPGYVSFTIPSNESHIENCFDFFNPEENIWYLCPECSCEVDERLYCLNCKKKCSSDEISENCYYLSFSLMLEENNEILYESNLVAPGKHIQTVDLNKELDAGEYDAILFIQPYKNDRKSQTNNGQVKLKLIVSDLF